MSSDEKKEFMKKVTILVDTREHLHIVLAPACNPLDHGNLPRPKNGAEAEHSHVENPHDH